MHAYIEGIIFFYFRIVEICERLDNFLFLS